MTAKVDWLTTEDGRVRIVALRPFKMILPATRAHNPTGVQLLAGRERTFAAGEHTLDPRVTEDAYILGHSWLCEQFADGSVERPEATRLRLKAEAEAAQAARVRQEALMREAQVALDRATIAAEATGQAGADMQSELDTPLNAPKTRRRGKAPEAPMPSSVDLDTPISQLPRA